MVALIKAAKEDGFPAEIAVVISNRADAAGLALAAAEGIDTVTIESKPFGKDRAAFEKVLQSTLEKNRIDLICLGGFMRLFTAEFVQAWYGKMLNIHPSLLPSFPGLDPHAQALNAGVKVSGATVHFVTPETDAGPIVMQGVVEVCDNDTPETLSTRILAIEHQIYPNALRLLASGKLRLDGAICRLRDDADAAGTLIAPRPRSE